MAQRKSYDAEFKDAALKRIAEGETVKAVAQDMDVSQNTLISWKRPKVEGVVKRTTRQAPAELDTTEIIRQRLAKITANKKEIERAFHEDLPKLDALQKALTTTLDALTEFDKLIATE